MFLPADLVAHARRNCETDPWAKQVRDVTVRCAKPWLDKSDDELWSLMFGPTITRSWMVWSNGHCPACLNGVPMYNWEIDAIERPWKTRCPHCKEQFPKNDFEKFHRSGLNKAGVFDPEFADRSLLFNAEHPDPSDPLHQFGVDDGEGYVQPAADGQPEKRWRFIGAYLIYGQWKQAMVVGIGALAAAYVLTGDRRYAHKAGVMLDRVADVYASFDHMKQAWVYETVRTEGFVSTWHDACEETREMILAYDFVRDALASDKELATFLAAKAAKHNLARSKATPADVCANIEEGILHTAIREQDRIHSNYPRREIALAVAHLVLGTPHDLKTADEMIDAMIERATLVDGVTGEKGLPAYASYVIVALAAFIAQIERMRPGAIKALMAKHPRLAKTYRFHIDTWCLEKYYPTIGDAGWFAGQTDHYVGARFSKGPSTDVAPSHFHGISLLSPSTFGLTWKLYEATGDAAYVQVLYKSNDSKTDGMPFDVLAVDSSAFRTAVDTAITKHGTDLQLGNVRFDQWRLAILRSGSKQNARAAWLNFDNGGAHGHSDGMTIGLFAKGLDLMPDLGYPPVHYGGWGSPRANWYRSSLSHNTVVVDGKNLECPWNSTIGGPATLWCDGKRFAAVSADGVTMLIPSDLSRVYKLDEDFLDHVALYAYRDAAYHRVCIYTKPNGSPEGETGWQLAFEDRFDRAALGADWKVVNGEWRIENGSLVGNGQLLCTRRFPGCQRVEYEATPTAAEPCDISAQLAVRTNGSRVQAGAFMGVGSNDGKRAKIMLEWFEAKRIDFTLERNRRYRVVSERDGDLLRVVVDGKEAVRHRNNADSLRAEREEAIKRKRFDRTLLRVDVSEADSYYVDVFRVTSGSEHTKFQVSHFGTVQTQGLNLAPGRGYHDNEFMRDFRTDTSAAPGWSVEWKTEDRYKLNESGRDVRMRYTDFTQGAEVSLCETWVVAGTFNSLDEAWVPRVLVTRRSKTPDLRSTFVSIVEPYEGNPSIRAAKRLMATGITGDSAAREHAALEVFLADGNRDIIVVADQGTRHAPASGAIECQASDGSRTIRLDGELAIIRTNASGEVTSLLVGNATAVSFGGVALRLRGRIESLELDITGARATVKSGRASDVETLMIDGTSVRVE